MNSVKNKATIISLKFFNQKTKLAGITEFASVIPTDYHKVLLGIR